MSKVLCFDFDGVICNSAKECLITGYNAWLKYNHNNNFYTKAEDIPADLAQYFYLWRGYVRTGGQYYIIFHSYGNSKLKNESDFEKANEHYKNEVTAYQRLFFEARDRIRDLDVDCWIRMHDAYEGVSENFQKINNVTDVFIVTGKDKRSVKTFLNSFGINFLEEKIYDKEAADNKLGALKEIAKITQKRLTGIIFLDDNIYHLLPPKQNGCQVFMAGWGYHCEEHLRKAKANNIEVLQLNNWKDRIMKELSHEVLQ